MSPWWYRCCPSLLNSGRTSFETEHQAEILDIRKLTGIDQKDQCGVAKRGSLLMKLLVVVLTDVQYVVIIIDQEGLFLVSDIGIIFSSYLCDHINGRIFLGKGEACQT
jgi:hypothetical protein